MTHREKLTALSGLLLGMFVVVLSAGVVNTSMPRIVADLGGSESAYTWVVSATLLAMTVTLPLWGKLSDLLNRKMLVQLSLVLYVVGSGLAGLSRNSSELIACRALQGLAVGGTLALTAVIMADLVSPRERGRYVGWLGAMTAAGNVSGPLIGGVITDSIGWRWNFYIGVPLAAGTLVVLQRTLHLPRLRRGRVSIDYLGVVLITGSVSLLMIWLSLVGERFSWASTQTVLMAGGSVLLAVVLVVVERRVDEPVLPLGLFRNRTVILATTASVLVGVVSFASTLFFAQYLQLARGKTPTVSGLMTMPMIVGTLLAATIGGQLITRTGKWKRYVATGAAALPVGVALLGTLRVDTSWVALGLYMAIVGVALGLLTQNLVLVVQNTLPLSQLGVGSSTVSFFRSLGGALGIAVMGALLTHRITSLVTHGLASRGLSLPPGHQASSVPNLAALSPPVRAVIQSAYGTAVADAFLAIVPGLLLAFVAVVLLPNARLGDKSGLQLAEEALGSVPLPADVEGVMDHASKTNEPR